MVNVWLVGSENIFITLFSATINHRLLIFGMQLQIGVPYYELHFQVCRSSTSCIKNSDFGQFFLLLRHCDSCAAIYLNNYMKIMISYGSKIVKMVNFTCLLILIILKSNVIKVMANLTSNFTPK